ncbi:MAG: TolC family protein [Terriglobia bacterium]
MALLLGVTTSILVFATCSLAQVGGPPPPSTRPTQLPLSGRNGQGGGVVATESPVPSTTTSVNAINPTISVSGAYSGSTSSTAAIPFSGKLSLAEAIRRGMAYNLGAVGMTQALRQVRGQAKTARGGLLPNISADVADTEETFNLRSIGFSFTFPGFALPNVVGPFNVLDVRGRLSQSIADFTAINNYRSARELVRASNFSAQDAQDLVVLAVAGSYLQVIAASARVEAARAQLETANTLYQQDIGRLKFGRIAQIDVNRSHVEMLLDQERLITLQNELAKQKIILARLTGLPSNDQYEILNSVPYAPAPPLDLQDAIKQALDQRADLKAAEAQVTAAERALAAARAERLPSGSVSADYGGIGSPSQLRPTYTVAATLSVPIWNGGRTAGDIEQARAALAQRRAELEDARSQAESDVRTAYLDMVAAANQVEVARQNLDVNHENLGQTRIKFEAGVSTNAEVVQSQESVSSAQLDYIDSIFAHNLAKLSLARALGGAADKLTQFLNVQ